MSKQEFKSKIEEWVIELINLSPFKSFGIFLNDDSGKIVSKEGRLILMDSDRIEIINDKIKDAEKNQPYSEITI